jgi:hypothetical protein
VSDSTASTEICLNVKHLLQKIRNHQLEPEIKNIKNLMKIKNRKSPKGTLFDKFNILFVHPQQRKRTLDKFVISSQQHKKFISLSPSPDNKRS